MPRDDWYRRTTWTPKHREEFFTRLARRQPFHRAQRLLIQALSLAETGRVKLVKVALELLELHARESDDPYNLMRQHSIAATCFEKLNQVDAAIEQHRLTLKARRKAPNQDMGTALELPWLIVSKGRTDLYEEALRVLRRAHIAFPVQKFQAAAIRARIADFQGEPEAAANYAKQALDAAAQQQSQFRYHRHLGLVGPEHEALIRRLRRIVRAARSAATSQGKAELSATRRATDSAAPNRQSE